jgi:hypothetical protein
MKKITKPQQNEEATYFSDFTGKLLGEYDSVNVNISCSYGSEYDGSKITFHLDNNDLLELMKFLKTKVSEDYKKEIKNKLKKLDKDYEDNLQFRDWQSCDYVLNNRELLKLLL